MKQQMLLVLLFSVVLAANVHSQQTETVWTIDFVKTKTDHQEDYLQFIRLNWAAARNEARKKGFIVSYRFLVLPSTADTDWNVLLMTEYKDWGQYEAREANFRTVFAKIRGADGPILIKGLGSKELADIKFSKVLNSRF